MGTGMAALTGSIDDLLADDVEVLSEEELHELVVGLARETARLAAARARAVARWDRVGGWTRDGSRSAPVALARDTMCSERSAARELQRARDLADMPATWDALASGRFSVDYAELLARANRPWREAVFSEHEAELVEQCAGLRFSEAVRVVKYWCQHADAIAADDEADSARHRQHLHTSRTLDGNVVINGQLDPMGGSVVMNELERIEREVFSQFQHDGVARTRSQRRAAALVEMARRSSGASGVPARPLFTVLVGEERLAHLCELADGTVVAPGALVPWMPTALLESVIFDGPSTVISVSHKRTFTGALRRAIQVRDRRCQHKSGCDVPADRCDIDHIVPRSRGGPTSQWNGRALCDRQNRNGALRDDPEPLPERSVHRLDEMRARIRWLQRQEPEPPDELDDEPHDHGEDVA